MHYKANKMCVLILAHTLICCGLTNAIADTAVGWRTDGTGRYPNADPVIEWGMDKNVIWKTELSEWGNATPVIVGDKIFICAEPDSLICVDKNSGDILWKRSVSILDLAKDDQERAKIRESLEKIEVIQKELDFLNKESQQLRKKIKENPSDKVLKKELQGLDAKTGEVKEKMKPYESYANPPAHNANGYTSATPVSDGKNVYVVLGTGIAFCCDLKGDLVWAKKLDRPPDKLGSCISPLIVGGVLIVQIDKMYGLDPATGNEKWSTKCGWGWGSPVVHSVGGVQYIFTCKGDMIRSDTGEILAKGLHDLAYGGPIADAGVVYYIQEKARAYKLPASVSGNIELKPAWKSTLKKDRYYGSPLLYDGLIYAITRTGVLSVLDIKTGEKVYEEKVPFAEGATVYPSITLGGKYIFISNEKGHTVVINPGRSFDVVRMNALDGFRSSPVFEGSRMYIRTLKNLYCIGK